MSTSMENSAEFEVVEPSPDHHDDENRMYVSASTAGTPERIDETFEDINTLTTNERNARLIGRRIDLLSTPTSSIAPPQWKRGTILNFDKEKDVHLILFDGESTRKECVLSQVVFRLVETEEEWVDIGERTLLTLTSSGHEHPFWS